MDAFTRILVAFSAAGLACGGTEPMPTESIAPELGTYTFTATWDGGSLEAHGELRIHAASETQINYSFILNEGNGIEAVHATIFDRTASDDWIIVSGSIQRPGDGAWVLLTHLAHIAGGYRCSGNAVNTNTQVSPLTCTFSYIGR